MIRRVTRRGPSRFVLLCLLWRKLYLIPARDANLPLHESLYLERNAVSLCGPNELSVDLEDAELH